MANAIEAPASVTAEGPTSHTQTQDLDALLSRLEQSLNDKATASGTYGYTRAEQIEALRKLREPFPPSEVRYRPQPWCKRCSETQGWPKVCQDHRLVKCSNCNGQKITDAHICLKYIGHAEATNRLLNVDPFWGWEPMALDATGLPQYDGNRALWIRMTVCGVTRIGYGDATGKNGANAVKEIIGDAIRNAAMRFGMALDLWTSSDLEIIESGAAADDESKPSPQGQKRDEKTNQPASGPSKQLARLMGQVTDCWKSDNVLIFEQIKSDGDKHRVLDEEFTANNGTVTTLRQVLDNRIAELKAAQGGATEPNAA